MRQKEWVCFRCNSKLTIIEGTIGATLYTHSQDCETTSTRYLKDYEDADVSFQDYTEWFKINLTLFMSHISHKWENIMNLFEDIYKL